LEGYKKVVFDSDDDTFIYAGNEFDPIQYVNSLEDYSVEPYENEFDEDYPLDDYDE